jgi:hypothetical protein
VTCWYANAAGDSVVCCSYGLYYYPCYTSEEPCAGGPDQG